MRRLALVGLLWTILLLVAVPASANEVDTLVPDSVFYLPQDPAQAGLVPWPDDTVLDALLESANTAASSDDSKQAHLGNVAAVHLSYAVALKRWVATPEASPPVAPFDKADIAALEAFGSLADDPDLLAAALLVAQKAPTAKDLPDAGQLLSLVTPTLEPKQVGRGLALSTIALRHGDWQEASEILSQLVPGDGLAPAVLFHQVQVATSRDNLPLVEKRCAALLKALDQQGRIHAQVPAMLEDLARDLLRATANRQDGWLRAINGIQRLPSDSIAAIAPDAERLYGASKEPMNRAQMLLFFARRDPERDLLLRVVDVIEAAVEIKGAPAAQLCLESLELLHQYPPMELDVVDGIAATCLELGPSRLSEADADGVVVLFDLLDKHHGRLFDASDRARYGLALVSAGQRSFAREQFEKVVLADLPDDLRAPFAAAAAELLYDTANELQLASLSCHHQHSLRTNADDTIVEWIGVAMPTASGESLFQLLEMQMALRLLAADYSGAIEDVQPLIDAAQGFGDGRLDAELGTTSVALAACLVDANRWTEAIALTRLLRLELDPRIRDTVFEAHGQSLVEVHLDQANALWLQGDPQSALDLLLGLERIWRQNPHSAPVAMTIAELLVALGQGADALPYYERVYDGFPDADQAHIAMFAAAQLWLAEGDVVIGRALLVRLMKEHPGSSFAARAGSMVEGLETPPVP